MDIESKYIKNVANLVPMPDIALDVLTMAHDVACDMKKLVKNIERDPSLTANMLKQDILELDVEDAAYEQRLLNTDHARVGLALLQGWGLPKRITEPVGSHHSHAEIETSPLHCRIVYLANRLEKHLGLHRGEPIENTGIALGQNIGGEPLPSVPGFSENMEPIVSESYERYFETATVFEL